MIAPFRDLSTWYKAIAEAKALVDSAMVDLPSDENQVRHLRGLVQKLDEVIFWGYEITRPKATPKRLVLTLEDLDL